VASEGLYYKAQVIWTKLRKKDIRVWNDMLEGKMMTQLDIFFIFVFFFIYSTIAFNDD